jgi:hypothetical protein
MDNHFFMDVKFAGRRKILPSIKNTFFQAIAPVGFCGTTGHGAGAAVNT